MTTPTAALWFIATFALVWLVRPGGWIDRRTPTWWARVTGSDDE